MFAMPLLPAQPTIHRVIALCAIYPNELHLVQFSLLRRAYVGDSPFDPKIEQYDLINVSFGEYLHVKRSTLLTGGAAAVTACLQSPPFRSRWDVHLGVKGDAPLHRANDSGGSPEPERPIDLF
ncbi:hypothetical protein FJ959_13785 [Mesorhizobium sp. B2-2-4]|nr:hypothetical protein FJ959_13785 [Mesorhizobium sp. B2-2-4]